MSEEESISQKEIIETQTEHWYTILLHYHDYTTFKITRLSQYYGINPSSVPSYDDFWKKIINKPDLNDVLNMIQNQYKRRY